MNLYFDSSALVKRYVTERGSEAVLRAMDGVARWAMCRIGFVETVRAVAREGGQEAVERVEREWIGFHVVEVDRAVTEHAAKLAVEHGLRSLDALHLAAALTLSAADSVFATWDVRLHRAAREQGLRTLPVTLG